MSGYLWVMVVRLGEANLARKAWEEVGKGSWRRRRSRTGRTREGCGEVEVRRGDEQELPQLYYKLYKLI